MRYFDHNATHPLSAAARAAWLDAVERYPANPSSPHRWGARSAKALDEARERLAARMGCLPHEIVWTSGATESNNTVIRHLGESTQGTVLLSPLEHPSVRVAAERWLMGRCEVIRVERFGRVDVEWVAARLSKGGVSTVISMAANNETGVIQPWTELRDLCVGAGVEYVCDASQWVGKLPSAGLGRCTWVTACGHKFGGPQGVGWIKVPDDVRPLLVGGPQEEGRRAGTENVAGILSMVAALEEREGLGGPGQRLASRDGFVSALKSFLPAAEVVGEGAERLWNTVAVLMPAARDCRRRWVVKLDRMGFAASTGSACASGKEQPSHVLRAMGYAASESDRMLRFSAGWETGSEEWVELIEAIRATAAQFEVME